MRRSSPSSCRQRPGPTFAHPAGSAGAREGHAAQLDFLVVSFLAGNDYLPKVRGANLPKLWARCAKLLSGEFRGQHLLRTAPRTLWASSARISAHRSPRTTAPIAGKRTKSKILRATTSA